MAKESERGTGVELGAEPKGRMALWMEAKRGEAGRREGKIFNTKHQQAASSQPSGSVAFMPPF